MFIGSSSHTNSSIRYQPKTINHCNHTSDLRSPSQWLSHRPQYRPPTHIGRPYFIYHIISNKLIIILVNLQGPIPITDPWSVVVAGHSYIKRMQFDHEFGVVPRNLGLREFQLHFAHRGGAHTSYFLDEPELILKYDPRVIFLQIGGNDITGEQSYKNFCVADEIIQLARLLTAHPTVSSGNYSTGPSTQISPYSIAYGAIQQ